MKILITGASGMLGRVLMQTLACYDPVGVAYTRVQPGLLKADLTDSQQLQDLIASVRPQVIIHAAAERRPDVSAQNPEKTLRLNVEVTRQLAELAKQTGAWLLYLSSDYIFDGSNPPYAVDATPNPLNFYGRSKLQGEHAIRQIGAPAGILRVPLLYGRVESWAESAVTVLYPLLDKSAAEVDHYAIRYPTLVDDVAKVCRRLVEWSQQQSNFSGTWHWSGAEPLTKYQMLQVMAELSGKSMDHVVPVLAPTDNVPRPRDCHLDCSVLENLGLDFHTPFREGIRQCIIHNS